MDNTYVQKYNLKLIWWTMSLHRLSASSNFIIKIAFKYTCTQQYTSPTWPGRVCACFLASRFPLKTTKVKETLNICWHFSSYQNPSYFTFYSDISYLPHNKLGNSLFKYTHSYVYKLHEQIWRFILISENNNLMIKAS